MKKITITLSDKAEKYFNEVAYSLDTKNGRLAFQSEIINHCLIELAIFEKFAGQSLSDYLGENWPDTFKGLVHVDDFNKYLDGTESNYNNSDQQDRFIVKEDE